MKKYVITYDRTDNRKTITTIRSAETAEAAAVQLCDQYGWWSRTKLIDADTCGHEWAKVSAYEDDGCCRCVAIMFAEALDADLCDLKGLSQAARDTRIMEPTCESVAIMLNGDEISTRHLTQTGELRDVECDAMFYAHGPMSTAEILKRLKAAREGRWEF